MPPLTREFPTDFRKWTLAHCAAGVRYMTSLDFDTDSGGMAAYTANAAYVERKDHWQRGINWPVVGGLPPEAASRIRENVRPQYAPIDVIGEGLSNFSNALVQREASLDFTPVAPIPEPVPPMDARGVENPDDPGYVRAYAEYTRAVKAQRVRVAGVVETMSGWWDKKKLWREMRASARRARYAYRGPTLVAVPTSALTRDPEAGDGVNATLPTDLPFAKAIMKVKVKALPPSTAVLFEHPETERHAAIVLTGRGRDQSAQLWFVDDNAPGDGVDGASGDTVVRVLRNAQNLAAVPETRYAFGGRLPLSEVEGELLVTEPVRLGQAQVNFANTIVSKTIHEAGFPERTTWNAEPHGVWVKEKPSAGTVMDERTRNGKTEYLMHVPAQMGSGYRTDLRGVVESRTTRAVAGTNGTETNERIATPGIHIKEPTNPAFATDAVEFERGMVLRGMHQGHLAITGGEESALAYIQARAAFESDLGNHKSSAEGACRDTIEAAIVLALQMCPADDPMQGFLDEFRCVVTLHPHAGPTTPDEQRVAMELYEGGVISRGTAQSRVDVEDASAEADAIDSDVSAKAKLIETALNLVKIGSETGGAVVNKLAAYVASELGLDPARFAAIYVDDNGNDDDDETLDNPADGDTPPERNNEDV